MKTTMTSIKVLIFTTTHKKCGRARLFVCDEEAAE